MSFGKTRQRRSPARGRAGFSLLEVSVVLVVMTVAVSMLASTMTASARVGPLMREEALAAEAARFEIESLRTVDFEDVYRTYNDDPSDDPEGAGTAPGRHFAVEGLDPREFDQDGFVGRFEFPEVGGVLREDSGQTDLGMPRDLNLDGLVDSASRHADYTILPFCVVIEWAGTNGPRELRMHSVVVAP